MRRTNSVPATGSGISKQVFQLVDAFSPFHFRYLAGRRSSDGNFWLRTVDPPSHRVWCGLAFERLCLLHQPQIRKALGIVGVLAECCAWHHRADDMCPDGAQIVHFGLFPHGGESHGRLDARRGGGGVQRIEDCGVRDRPRCGRAWWRVPRCMRRVVVHKRCRAYAAWAVEAPVSVPLPQGLEARSIVVRDIYGNPRPQDQPHSLTLTESPVYVIGNTNELLTHLHP